MNKALVHPSFTLVHPCSPLFTLVHRSCVLKGDSETMNDAIYNVLMKISQTLEEIAEHLEVISNELNGDSNG